MHVRKLLLQCINQPDTFLITMIKEGLFDRRITMECLKLLNLITSKSRYHENHCKEFFEFLWEMAGFSHFYTISASNFCSISIVPKFLF